MKTFRFTILASVMALSLVVPSYAALTNYVTSPRDGFEAAVLLLGGSGTYTQQDYWFSSNSNWSRYTSDYHSGSRSLNLPAYNNSSTIFTVVNMPNQGQHTFTLSFWTKYYLTNTSSVSVYGNVNQPASGSSATTGTLIGSYNLPTGDFRSAWNQKTYTFTPTSNYSWFTIVFNINTNGGSSRYFRVDDISMVPIPPAALLLASGLIGLVGLRRFGKKD